jgi:CheY-specific phosphatase CheX
VIPLLAALPAVQSVVGGVVGSVAGNVASMFSDSQPSAPASPAMSPSFSSAMNSASSAAASATISTSCGIMRSDQLGQMTNSEVQSWAKGLTGRHVDVTDAAGHAVSGVVNSVVQSGSNTSLNINGHLVSLSSVKQISWSATA